MCDCGEYLEIYKRDTTFRLQSPESIDPERTNPNAPFVAVVSARVGSANPIVARVLLQGVDLLQSAAIAGKINQAAVTTALHAIKEALVACDTAARAVGESVDSIVVKVKAGGVVRDPRGNALSNLPQVPDLDAHVTAFLIHAKRAIQQMSALPRFFLPLKGADTDLDHLGNRLAKHLGADAPLTTFVRGYAPAARFLIELRNAQEHPKSKQCIVRNVHISPNGAIGVPVWHVTGGSPSEIAEDMKDAIAMLLEFTEWLLIDLIMGAVDKRWPYIIVETPDDRLDPDKPVKYRLSFNLPAPAAPLPEDPKEKA